MEYFPVTFESDEDAEGVVHHYAKDYYSRTLCGKRLSSDHGCVSVTTTKEWCGRCEDLA